MSTLANLVVRLGLNADGFTSGMQQASKQIGTAMREANKGMQGFQRLGSAMQSAGQRLSIGLTLPLVGFGAAALNSAAKMESLKLALETIAGSAEGAEQQFERLRQSALLPGLTMESAIQGSVRLQQIGFSAEDAATTLEAFGNALASAGRGAPELERVVTQLAQMGANSKIIMQDLRPVITQVPAASRVLLEYFGTIEASEINKKLDEMGLSTKDFVMILVQELGKLPEFTGGIENTFENLRDTVTVAMSEMGAPLAEIAKNVIPPLAEAITRAATAFAQLSPKMQTAIVAATGLAAALGPILLIGGNLITTTLALKAAIAGLSVSMPILGTAAVGVKAAFAGIAGVMTGPVGIVALLGVSLVGAIYAVKKSFVEMEDVFTKANKKIREEAEKADTALENEADAAWELHSKVIALKKELESQGIVVEEGNRTLQEYYDALVAAKDANASAKTGVSETTTAVAAQSEAVQTLEEYWKALPRAQFVPPTGPLYDYAAAINAANQNLSTMGTRMRDALAEMEPFKGGVSGVTNRYKELNDAMTEGVEDFVAKVPEFQEAATTSKSAWTGAMQDVSTNISNAAQDITAILMGTKEGSMLDAFKRLGQSVVTSFVEPATKAISDFITNALSKLIGKILGSDGVLGAFGKLGDVVGGVFSSGGSAIGGAVGGAGSAAGSVAGGAGGFASSLGGVAGAVNLVSGVISAVGSIAQVLQGFQIEAGLDAVEEESRKNQLHNLFSLEKMNEYLPFLESINNAIWSLSGADGILGQINESVRDMRFGGLAEVRQQLVAAIQEEKNAVVNGLSGVRTEVTGVRNAITNNNTFNISGASGKAIAAEIALALQGVSG